MFSKKELVFATNNAHKLQEVREMLGNDFEIKGLKDIGCEEDIEETGSTFQENASLKSHYVFNKFSIDCFSDDSGLEVDALNGAPGVYSARYAGEHGNSEANIDKLLKALEGVNQRQAQFKSVISLLLNGKEYFFEGIVRGTICYERSGVKGFGYDPVFQPDGHSQTFAEMTSEQKNALSHRGHSIRQLVDFLKTQTK